MTDSDRFDHFLKKIYECLHLHYRHYLPQGKPEPVVYRDVFFQLYKIYYSGVLEELNIEPVMEEEVKQLDLFAALKNELSANLSLNFNGTEVDQQKTKTD